MKAKPMPNTQPAQPDKWDEICAVTQRYFDGIRQPNPSATKRMEVYERLFAPAQTTRPAPTVPPDPDDSAGLMFRKWQASPQDFVSFLCQSAWPDENRVIIISRLLEGAISAASPSMPTSEPLREALELVHRGFKEGYLKDRTILKDRGEDGRREMVALSEIVSNALSAHPTPRGAAPDAVSMAKEVAAVWYDTKTDFINEGPLLEKAANIIQAYGDQRALEASAHLAAAPGVGLEVPQVWPDEVIEAMNTAWNKAKDKRGHYETLMAVAAAAIRSLNVWKINESKLNG